MKYQMTNFLSVLKDFIDTDSGLVHNVHIWHGAEKFLAQEKAHLKKKKKRSINTYWLIC